MTLLTIHPSFSLLTVAAVNPNTAFEFGRIQTPRDWTTPLLCLAAMILFIFWRYRREGEELKPIIRRSLALIRTLAFVVILIIYLQPQWRSRVATTTPSRVIILIDSSASMGVKDGTPEVGRNAPTSRAEQAARLLASTGVIDALREDHEILIATFDEELNRVALFTLTSSSDEDNETSPDQLDPSNAADWAAVCRPIGQETRLGECLARLLESENQSPIAGLILITDGGQNAGESIEQALLTAQRAGIPIHTLGVGDLETPANLRVVELNAAPRIFPGDRVSVTGLIQQEGGPGDDEAPSSMKTVRAELRIRSINETPGENTAPQERLLQAFDIEVSESGDPTPVSFEFTLQEEGRFILSLRAVSEDGDARPEDDVLETDIQVLARRERILLLAGGPCRDYQFLQAQLYRDPAFEVDVILQSAPSTAFQDADAVLTSFPATKEEMYSYDCLVAFDPDWTQLDELEIELIESWVATQSGGLIVTAGPVHAGDAFGGWTNVDSMSMTTIRTLYPVVLHEVGENGLSNPRTLHEPRPLILSREGREAGFLRLDDSTSVSLSIWDAFPGVYGFQPIEGLKLAARPLASVEDPRLEAMGENREYMVDQFFGLGRVLYLGSAELWRLRQNDVAHFERLYAKMIRNVSQGRLMRTTGRGAITSQQDEYTLGATAVLRAQLTDSEWEPLLAPSVQVEAFHEEGGLATTFDLFPTQERPGVFEGRFPLREEGTYRFELPLMPMQTLNDASATTLTHRIRVRTPDLERENPRRNEALLAEIAERTEGAYYPNLETALNPEHSESVVPALIPRPRTVIRTLPPHEQWERRWPLYCMLLLCGLLCTEWLIRRLVRLA